MFVTARYKHRLTRYQNRRYFDQFFDREWRRALREKRPIAIIMVDVDHFKMFNDTHGHPSGDEALRVVAGIIQDGIRNYDMIGRYGGEEIIAFLPETDSRNAFIVAERLRKAVEAGTVTPVGE